MFRRWGVDIDLARMLALLDQQGAMAAGDIVRVMALPQSTISHQLKRLETLGYVVRAASQRDSRMIIVSLTTVGGRVARESNGLSREVSELLDSALAGLDRHVFSTALTRIDEQLAELRSIGGAAADGPSHVR
jgi:DNA-binding MarR family transcriptional regulator